VPSLSGLRVGVLFCVLVLVIPVWLLFSLLLYIYLYIYLPKLCYQKLRGEKRKTKNKERSKARIWRQKKKICIMQMQNALALSFPLLFRCEISISFCLGALTTPAHTYSIIYVYYCVKFTKLTVEARKLKQKQGAVCNSCFAVFPVYPPCVIVFAFSFGSKTKTKKRESA